MIAVRNIHFNKTGEFDLKKWITASEEFSQQTCEYLIETWNYCLQIIKEILDSELFLRKSSKMLETISKLNIEANILCTDLLFPLKERKIITKNTFCKNFDRSIISFIYETRNVLKNHQLGMTCTNNFFSKGSNNNFLYTLVMTIIENFRYALLKLVEHVMFLRGIKDIPRDNCAILVKKYSNAYISLSNHFRVEKLKWELEDYYFRYLYPLEYSRIVSLLNKQHIDRECYIENFVRNLYKSMKKEGIKAKVYGRPKHIYSIWKKMQKKCITFNELFDVHAVRIIANQLQDCYDTLRVIHRYFHYLPNEFDDYIAHPKKNGYQSIHTVILGPESKVVEVQIRTKKMHEDAELGFAAHWRYKESISTLHYSVMV